MRRPGLSRETPYRWILLGLLLLVLAGIACEGEDPVPAGHTPTPLTVCLDECAVTCENEQGVIVQECAIACAFTCFCEEECRLNCRDEAGVIDEECYPTCVSEECIPAAVLSRPR
jgi:hypothetical protein